MNKLKSAYNRCLKTFFGYSRHFSVMQLLLDLRMPSWNTLITNSQSVFIRLWQIYENRLISHMCMLGPKCFDTVGWAAGRASSL